jgi:hypothetical protein
VRGQRKSNVRQGTTIGRTGRIELAATKIYRVCRIGRDVAGRYPLGLVNLIKTIHLGRVLVAIGKPAPASRPPTSLFSA